MATRSSNQSTASVFSAPENLATRHFHSSFDELSATSFSVILADAEFYRGNLGLAKGAFQSILRDVEKLSENYAALVSLRLAQIKAHDSSDEERDWEQAVDRSFAAESPFWIAQSALGLSQLRRRQGKKSQILDGFKLAVSALDDLKPSRTHIEALFFAVEAMTLRLSRPKTFRLVVSKSPPQTKRLLLQRKLPLLLESD